MTQQMIERRRDKLTLNWRPKGTPARRVDDFAEVPHLAVAPTPAPVPEERREIGGRLENWARWATSNGRTINVSPTGAFCDRLRREALGEEQRSGERRSIDENDALRLERVMPQLETRHRLMIYWCYIKQAQPEMVCRKLSIAHRPATMFIAQFRQAQVAVENLLEIT